MAKEITRYISNEVGRELWAKAAGRCQFNLIRVNSPQLAAKGPFLIGAFDTP